MAASIMWLLIEPLTHCFSTATPGVRDNSSQALRKSQVTQQASPTKQLFSRNFTVNQSQQTAIPPLDVAVRDCESQEGSNRKTKAIKVTSHWNQLLRNQHKPLKTQEVSLSRTLIKREGQLGDGSKGEVSVLQAQRPEF